MSQLPTGDRYELYRVITDYEALQEAFIDRIEDLNVNRDMIDTAGGFTPGYSAKLLCVPPMKTLGKDSLGKMMLATGLVLIAVIDDERFAKTKARLAAAKAEMVNYKKSLRPIVRIKRVKGYFTNENAGIMSRRRWASIPADVRSKIMRKVIKARYRAIRRRKQQETASV